MNIEQGIESFILDELLLGQRSEPLAADSSLISSGIIDSLGLVRLITFIEEKFNVQIGDDELVPDHFETINSVTDLVKSKL